MSNSSGNQLRIALNWHESRRVQGVPTISVLVGPDPLGYRMWRRWNAEKNRRVVVGRDLAGATSDWLHQEVDLADYAIGWIRRNLNGAAAEFPALVRMTPHDLCNLWRDLPSPRVDPIASIAYRILAAVTQLTPFDHENAVSESGSAHLLSGLYGLIPEQRRPAFLVLYPTINSEARSGLLPVVREFEEASKLVPQLSLAICVSEQEYEAAVAQPSRGRRWPGKAKFAYPVSRQPN